MGEVFRVGLLHSWGWMGTLAPDSVSDPSEPSPPSIAPLPAQPRSPALPVGELSCRTPLPLGPSQKHYFMLSYDYPTFGGHGVGCFCFKIPGVLSEHVSPKAPINPLFNYSVFFWMCITIDKEKIQCTFSGLSTGTGLLSEIFLEKTLVLNRMLQFDGVSFKKIFYGYNTM